jgi:hypothetical protein
MNTPSPEPLPADVTAQLAQLRDIRLPDAISWWPPAPGWWIVAGVLLAGIACLAALEFRRRRSLKYKALRELDQLRRGKAFHLSTHGLASELCVLIRRVVLNRANGSRHAGTHGDAWAVCLAAAPNGMPQDIARFIASAPYVPRDPADEPLEGSTPSMQALVSATEKWIRRHA